MGYQLVLFSNLLGAAGAMYGIFEQYKRLTGNAVRGKKHKFMVEN